jgi:hypothetical protein
MRRRELVERSAAQRAALGTTLAPMVHKAAAVDRALAAVRRHPLLAVALAGGVAMLGSRRLFGFLARGITLYTLLRKI